VAGIVRENSDSLAEIGAEKAPWKQRKIDYLKGIETKSKSALLVSLSDKVHNTRALIADTRNVGESHWKRFNAEKSELLWYYQSLAESFEARKEDYPELKPAIAELSFAVKTLHTLAA
jgi:(p)ppGpp synthase/HD superfamily hydrolase